MTTYHKKCVVLGCESTGQRLRSFPLAKDRERFLKWLKACGNIELLKLSEKQLRHKVVCDKHFEARVKLASTLSRVAIPTLYLPKPIDVSVYKFNTETVGSRTKQNQMTDENFTSDEVARILAELSESDVGGSEDEASEEEHILDAEQRYEDAEQDDAFSSDSSDPSDRPAIVDSIYIGRDNITVWEKTPCASKLARIPTRQGFVASKNEITDELSALREIIDDAMLEEIVSCTNLSIEHKRMSNAYSKYRDVKGTTRAELLALIGLLYLVGMKRASHTNLLELWTDDGTGLEICRSTMGYRRFLFLLDCLRFDDRNTRATRLKVDKLAPIRDIWQSFTENCKNSYAPSESLVVGDRLKSFRGKCSFIQRVPGKPAKQGLKIACLVDAKTSFTCNMELCCGKQPKGPYQDFSDDPAAIVYRLIKHVKGSNTNVTCDNRYVSYSFAISLLDERITFLGAMGRAHGELPSCFLPEISRLVGSSRFGFRGNATLVSHVPERDKAVIVLSTAHRDVTINPDTVEPTIVEDYNATKDAVNVVERTCAIYSVSKKTRRWPLAVFFALLDVAGVNAQILYNASQRKTLQKYRRGFLKNLAFALLKPHLKERAKIKILPLNIRSTVLRQGCVGCGDDEQRKRSHEMDEEDEEEDPAKKMGRCFICGRRKNTSTSLQCDSCSKFTCKAHVAYIKYTCEECYANEVAEDHR